VSQLREFSSQKNNPEAERRERP